MGVKKEVVQKIIFHSMLEKRTNIDDSGLLGVNILPEGRRHTFDISIADNTLHMYSVCTVPAKAWTVEDNGDAMLEHIVSSVMRIYKSMAQFCTFLILCDDGCKSFKPAVRETRLKAPTTPALEFLKKFGQTKIKPALFDALDDAGIRYVHMEGKDSTYKADSPITVGEQLTDSEIEELCLTEFGASRRSFESDTLMYEYVLHLRTRGYLGSICVMSKDSDIVASAMTLVERKGEEFLGNLTIGFMNPMMSSSKINKRDFDIAVESYKWNCKILSDNLERRRPVEFGSNNFWQQLLDVDPIHKTIFDKYFSEICTQIIELIKRDKFLAGALPIFFQKCWQEGMVGPVARRILKWLTMRDNYDLFFAMKEFVKFTVEEDSAKPFVLKSFLVIAKEFLVEDSDFGDLKISHFPAISHICAKYAAGIIPFGTYGKYLSMLGHNRFILYVQVKRTNLTAGCVALCALAGSDYSMPLAKLGKQRITQLIGSVEFSKAASRVVPANRNHNWEKFMFNLLDKAGLCTHPKVQGAELDSLKAYLQCVWLTLHYTLDTWALEHPVPSENYGYSKEGQFAYCEKKIRKVQQLLSYKSSNGKD